MACGRAFISAKAADAHLAYLQGDGVTKDGEKGQVYSADRDVADGRVFLDRGREDRHKFRFIVSAEEDVELSDLRETTRDLMKQMEADLESRLERADPSEHSMGVRALRAFYPRGPFARRALWVGVRRGPRLWSLTAVSQAFVGQLALRLPA